MALSEADKAPVCGKADPKIALPGRLKYEFLAILKPSSKQSYGEKAASRGYENQQIQGVGK